MRDGLKWMLTGARREERPAPVALAMQPDPERAGICCSGGGIRSASFNLGALQALQKAGELNRAKYLAAVSGGSYIAAAFCMAAKTAGKKNEDSDPRAFTESSPPFAPGSPEEQYVRNHVSYMAPNGLARIFLLFRVLTGLVWNLVFLGLPLAATGILLARWLYKPEYGDLTGTDDVCVADENGRRPAEGCGLFDDINPWVWDSLTYILVVLAFVGFVNLVWRFRTDLVRQAWETWAIRLILLLGAAVVVLVVVPVLIDIVLGNGGRLDGQEAATTPEAPAVGGIGIVTLLGGVVLHLRSAPPAPPAAPSLPERAGTVAKAAEKAWGVVGGLPARMRLSLVYLIGAIVGPLVLLGITAYAGGITLASAGPDDDLLWAAGLFGAFLVIYLCADLNTWSLHPFYRRRLCSAFALKRMLDEHARPVAVERRYDDLVSLSQSAVGTGPDGRDWPKLLVCAAANVSDPGATPPGRGVTTFTFTADRIGGPLTHKIPTTDYEGVLGPHRSRDITLPAAVAMSGAAISPSMGKITLRPLRFLLALANVRLGVWVPNPRRIEKWKERGEQLPMIEGNIALKRTREFVWRKPRPWYLLMELLGRNRLNAKFLYVTDGGHYDNLGLVELLRRGCTTVYCIDASGGKGAKELGDAIALARSELAVDVDIDAKKIVESGSPPFAEQCVQRGTITYPPVGDAEPVVGKLVYVRSVMFKGLSWDVTSFRDVDPLFPHHSTADQLYTDQKFEAYRALGYAAGEEAIAAMEDAPTSDEPETSGSVE